MTDTQWFWKGKWLEYCSCDWGCPCESNAPPSRGHCDGVVAMHIDEGNYGDVKLDGITVVATFFFPRALHHGGGHMQPILPASTTPEQRDAIFKIMSGEGQPRFCGSGLYGPASRGHASSLSRILSRSSSGGGGGGGFSGSPAET